MLRGRLRVPRGIGLVVDGRVRKDKALGISDMESIALKSFNNDSCLDCRFEVGEAERDFHTRFLLAPDETNTFEARKRPENVGDFTLRGGVRDSFYVNSVRGVRGQSRNRVGLELGPELRHVILDVACDFRVQFRRMRLRRGERRGFLMVLRNGWVEKT